MTGRMQAEPGAGEDPICRQVAPARAVMGLGEVVSRGLAERPRTMSPKFLYDEKGSSLFDEICDQPEYYPTRTEDALLAESAKSILELTRPDAIFELGSGMSRKTRRVLDACEALGIRPHYTAFDISEDALIAGGKVLAEAYPWLEIELLVGDYEAGFANLPRSDGKRLFMFLGSTIGNFEPPAATSFLADLRSAMAGHDWLLLGADRVKDEHVLKAAYNDRAGVTADFNLNLLRVLNKELGADFDLDRFRHHAFYNADQQRIEMHLVAETAHAVRIGDLDLRIALEAGETIRTEISRKFTEQSLTEMLADSGFALRHHFTPDNAYFSLALAQPKT